MDAVVLELRDQGLVVADPDQVPIWLSCPATGVLRSPTERLPRKLINGNLSGSIAGLTRPALTSPSAMVR